MSLFTTRVRSTLFFIKPLPIWRSHLAQLIVQFNAESAVFEIGHQYTYVLLGLGHQDDKMRLVQKIHRFNMHDFPLRVERRHHLSERRVVYHLFAARDFHMK